MEQYGLPCTNDEQVAQFQAEYQAAFNAGSQDELEAAKCRYGLVVIVAYVAVLVCVACISKEHFQRGPFSRYCV